jgi:hypothetical protein
VKMPPDFRGLLTALIEHKVDFIVVGGLSAVLRGVPISTFDLDIVHSRVEANLTRLLAALDTLEAQYRGVGDRRIAPNLGHLRSSGHQLLTTNCGMLDVLGSIGTGMAYEDLVEHSSPLKVHGKSVRVLELEQLVVLKEQAARPKDLATLPIIRATLRLQSEAGDPPET